MHERAACSQGVVGHRLARPCSDHPKHKQCNSGAASASVEAWNVSPVLGMPLWHLDIPTITDGEAIMCVSRAWILALDVGSCVLVPLC
jgi:hypothetical protein